MHTDLLGVRGNIIGSVLLELCQEGEFGLPASGGWKERLQEQFNLAAHTFKAWMKATNRSCHFHGFTIGMFGLSKLASWPVLHLKAFSAQVCTDWLYQLHMSRSLTTHVTEKLELPCYGAFP